MRAWIEIIDEADAANEANEANEDLRAAYKAAGSRSGSAIDNILAVHSLHPQSLLDHLELYKTIMHRRSELSRVEREIMAVVVSSINECHY